MAQQLTERKLLVEGLVILAAVLVLRNGLTGISLRRLRPPSTRAITAPSTKAGAAEHG